MYSILRTDAGMNHEINNYPRSKIFTEPKYNYFEERKIIVLFEKIPAIIVLLLYVSVIQTHQIEWYQEKTTSAQLDLLTSG